MEGTINNYRFFLVAGIFGNRVRIRPKIDQLSLISKIDQALETLPQKRNERTKKILRLRFGLDDGERKTLDEIGQEFYLTKERVRQVEAEALKLLRHPSRSKDLRGFVETISF